MQLSVSESCPVRAFDTLYETVGNTTRFDMHYELELGVVLAGRCRRYREQQQCDLNPGDAWFSGMWQTHGIEVLAAPCRLFVAVIWPPLLADMRLPELPQHNWLRLFAMDAPMALVDVSVTARQDLRRTAAAAAAMAGGTTAAERVHLRLRFLDLLLRLDGLAEIVREPSLPAVGGARLRDINPALELVFASRRVISNDEAARRCGMSLFRFIRQFAALMGISFAQFALRHRLRGAADLLRDSDLPVKAVAHAWGFTDESHLHRLFRRHYGCTPRSYRSGR